MCPASITTLPGMGKSSGTIRWMPASATGESWKIHSRVHARSVWATSVSQTKAAWAARRCLRRRCSGRPPLSAFSSAALAARSSSTAASAAQEGSLNEVIRRLCRYVSCSVFHCNTAVWVRRYERRGVGAGASQRAPVRRASHGGTARAQAFARWPR